jgi:uncharacterized surface protein with fasciclin (FAS1) repeats
MKKLLSSSALLALMATGYAYAEASTYEPQTTAQANVIMLEQLRAEPAINWTNSSRDQQVAANDDKTSETIWDAMADLSWQGADLEATPESETAISVSTRMYQPGLIEDDGASERDREATNSIADLARDPNGVDLMIQLLEVSGLDETLQGDQTYTVFAPTNAAFREIDEQQLNRFVAGYDQTELENILKAHIVEGEVIASDLADEPTEIVTASEQELVLREDSLGQIRVENAFVIASDASASNGVIHVIDKPLSLDG